MSPALPDQAVGLILSRYGLPGTAAHPLGNHGGFSGAHLWRVEVGTASFCLRAWPPGDPTPERLQWLHDLMAAARGAGLALVPHVVAVGGATFVAHAGRLWELSSWLPGRADFHQNPAPPRLRAACVALARLHRAWAGLFHAEGPCGALDRRRRRAGEWLALVGSGWRPRPDRDDPVRAPAERAFRVLPDWVGRVGGLLEPFAGRRLALQPCLCDIWHDHVLFEGDVVSGIVDYGSMKVEHPAADLARLLGSLAGDDPAAWTEGLDAYATFRPLAPEERALAAVLDRTGVIVAAAIWLTWLYRDGRAFDDRQLVADRLAELVRRMEGWARGASGSAALWAP